MAEWLGGWVVGWWGAGVVGLPCSFCQVVFPKVDESKAASIQAVFARLFFPRVSEGEAASIQAVFVRLVA